MKSKIKPISIISVIIISLIIVVKSYFSEPRNLNDWEVIKEGKSTSYRKGEITYIDYDSNGILDEKLIQSKSEITQSWFDNDQDGYFDHIATHKYKPEYKPIHIKSPIINK